MCVWIWYNIYVDNDDEGKNMVKDLAAGIFIFVEGEEIELDRLSDGELWVLYRRLELDSEYDEISRKLLDEIHFRERVEAYNNLQHES